MDLLLTFFFIDPQNYTGMIVKIYHKNKIYNLKIENMPLKKEKFSGRQNIFESVSVEKPDQRKLQTQTLKRKD